MKLVSSKVAWFVHGITAVARIGKSGSVIRVDR